MGRGIGVKGLGKGGKHRGSPEDWPEPHASLFELEPVTYSFSRMNPKPMYYIDPLTTRECIIICEFYSDKNKGVYKYDVTNNNAIMFKDIPQSFINDSYQDYGYALDKIANTLYIYLILK